MQISVFRQGVVIIMGLLVAGVAWATGTAGTTDTTFGTSGLLEVRADRIAVDSTGHVVVAKGNYRDSDGNYYWRLRRFDADGSIDSNFSEVLLYASPATQTASWIHGLGIDSQGRVLVAGERLIETTTQKGKKTQTTTKQAFVLRRYTSSGVLDTDFADGEVVLGHYTENDAFSGLADLVVLADDSVLVVGDGPVTTTTSGGGSGKGRKGSTSSSSRGIVVALFGSDGVLDTSYGNNGYATYDRDTTSDGDIRVLEAAAQSDGSLILLAGPALPFSGSTVDAALFRITADGDFDSSFGLDGEVSGPTGHELRSMAIDNEDGIYLSSHDYGVEVAIGVYDADGLLESTTNLSWDWTASRGLHAAESAAGEVMIYVVGSTQSASVFPARLILDGQGGVEFDTSYGPNSSGTGDSRTSILDARLSAVSPSHGAFLVYLEFDDGSPSALWKLSGDV